MSGSAVADSSRWGIDESSSTFVITTSLGGGECVGMFSFSTFTFCIDKSELVGGFVTAESISCRRP